MMTWHRDPAVYRVYRTFFYYSLLWLLVSNIFLGSNFAYHLAQGWSAFSISTYILSLVMLLAFVCSCAAIVACLRSQTWSAPLWYASALINGLLWALLIFSVHYIWRDEQAIDKVTVIAFFTLLVAWYVRIELLFVALLPLMLMDLYLEFNFDPRAQTEVLLMLSKYPILLAIFLFTLRKMFLFGLHEHVKAINLNKALAEAALTDELTKIANRKAFNQALARAVDQAERFKVPFCLVICDIDYFKQYNDLLGHPAGDACLVKFAKALSQFMSRKTDLVARIGGEEFALLFSSSEIDDAERRLDVLRAKIEAMGISHPGSSVSPSITASFGLAQYKNGESADELYKRVDGALYSAKQAGRNCYSKAV